MAHRRWPSGVVARGEAGLQLPNNSAVEVNTGRAPDALQACSQAAVQRTTAVVRVPTAHQECGGLSSVSFAFSFLFSTVGAPSRKVSTFTEKMKRGWARLGCDANRGRKAKCSIELFQRYPAWGPFKAAALMELLSAFGAKWGHCGLSGQPDQVGGHPELVRLRLSLLLRRAPSGCRLCEGRHGDAWFTGVSGILHGPQ